MSKIESLKKLLEIIESTDLAKGKYCNEDGENCMIGHLLKLGGVTDDQLKEIDNGKYNSWYSIDTVLKITNVEDDFVKSALEGLGFNVVEDRDMLNELQMSNDSNSKKYTIGLLKEKIKEIEEK